MGKAKRNILKSWASKKLLTIIVIILLLLLFVFLSFQGYLNLKQNEKINEAVVIDSVDQRISLLYFQINEFPSDASKDILFLGSYSSLRKLVNAPENQMETELNDVEEDFLEFLEDNDEYYKLRYIDNSGLEKIKVESKDKNQRIVPKNELQNKKHRYYFDEAMKLNEGEVFISQVDLNFENGILENRGSEENPIYVPVVRFIIPVFDDSGERQGFVISNIYADSILKDLRSLQKNEEKIFLINQDGNFLIHPDEEKEFSFMFGKEYTLYNEYPEDAEKIFQSYERRILESNDLVYSFRYIYPASATHELFKGSANIFDGNPDEEYFWILLSVSERDDLEIGFKGLRQDYNIFLIVFGITIAVIILFVFIIAFKKIKE